MAATALSGAADGGRIDMDVFETEQAVARLGAVGSELREAWSTTAGRLDSGVSRLGHGPMGQRFLAVYRPVDTRLHTAAEAAVAEAARLAEAGQRCIASYDSADIEAGEEFGQVSRDH